MLYIHLLFPLYMPDLIAIDNPIMATQRRGVFHETAKRRNTPRRSVAVCICIWRELSPTNIMILLPDKLLRADSWFQVSLSIFSSRAVVKELLQ